MWLLPAPAGAIEHRRRGRGGEHLHHGGGLLGVEVCPGDGGACLGLGDQLRDRALGGGEDLFFGVEVVQGGVPVFVRGPVDAAAVGSADAEAGHVGDVGGGHADHAGTGAAGDSQFRHLGDHGVGVGAGGQDGQGAVDFEAQLRHRPDGVMLLDFGDGDPRGLRLAASSSTAGALAAVCLPRSAATCACTCDSAWISRRVVWASHAANRSASVGSSLPVCPARVRRACVLAAAGVLPGLLVQQPQRAPARRGAVAGFVLVGQPLAVPR